MLEIGPIGFLSPWFLIGLLALPLLWLLLRATPPRPKRLSFPGVGVLLGIESEERTPKRTPWWLLLLRVLAAALLLSAFAEPLLNPNAREPGDGPILLVMDGGWTSAETWERRRAAALDLLAQAREADRPVAFANLADGGPAPEALTFETADAVAERVRALSPAAWRPDRTRLDAALDDVEAIEAAWFVDGLSGRRTAADGDAAAALAEALAEKGPLTLYRPARPPIALGPPEAREGAIAAILRRAEGGPERATTVAAFGAPRRAALDGLAEAETVDANAAVGRAERRLASQEAAFEAGAVEAEAEIELPLELRNALTRLSLVEAPSAGAVALLDDSYRRRRVAIVSGQAQDRDQPLLSGVHYLRTALEGRAAARETTLTEALGLPEAGAARLTGQDETPAAATSAWADVIVLADIGEIDLETARALEAWVRAGGLLIRFAGPRLAAFASEAADRQRRVFVPPGSEPPPDLLPTALRGGGRALGGALSWSRPQPLAAFPPESPFAGLEPTGEVAVGRQVLAQPGPELSDRVWAALQDGTPLVTARPDGAGVITLFHVTANADWSNLPLSGLFVEMLGRLTAYAPALAGGVAAAEADDLGLWLRSAAVDGRGRVVSLEDDPAAAAALGGDVPVPTAGLRAAQRLGASADAPPGIYLREAGEGADAAAASLALSAVGSEEVFEAAAPPPAGAIVRRLSDREEIALKPPLLAVAFLLLAADVLAALFVAGRLAPRAAALLLGLGLAGGLAGLAPTDAVAQARATQSSPTQDAVESVRPQEFYAALESVFAHVVTGDRQVDRTAAAGLRAVSRVLFQRTSIEPGEPAAVNLDTDEIAVYSMIYWPVTESQPALGDAAIRRMNQFLRTGGLLVVDTRDAHLSVPGRDGPNARHLRRLLGPLDIPPLEPMDANHLVTRTFYIVDGAPGRWNDSVVWVQAGTGGDSFDREAIDAGAQLNDGVSSIVLGGADWAAAWALDESGRGMFPLGGGRNGRRDGPARELAHRFGVNLAMYAYTGSYKSDQVHITEILDRLGN